VCAGRELSRRSDVAAGLDPPGSVPEPQHTVKWKLMSDKDQENQEQRMPLPPASFEFLTLSLRTQAEFQLGLMHFGPPEEKPEPDFELARHSIDLLGVLQEKTRGNLSLEEQRMLENSLTELRFRYVQVMEESRKPKAGKPDSSEKAEESSAQA
jgi:hypothetical protein